MENPVPKYYRILNELKMPLPDATFYMISHHHALCASVMIWCGSWPSSEPEIASLQLRWRG